MYNYILLSISLVAALVANVTKKEYTVSRQKSLADGFTFSAFSFIAATLILLPGALSAGSASRFTVLMGLLFGAVTTLQSILLLLALQSGPMSYTLVIVNFSTLITSLSGVIFFDEPLYISQILGIALMLVSFVCSAKSDPQEKKANCRWLVLCIIAFISTGAIGIMQKLHQSSDYKFELDALLVIAFASSALYSFIPAFIFKFANNSRKLCTDNENTKNGAAKLILLILLQGIGIALNNRINLYLSGVISSSVFFPVVNVGTLTITTLYAVLVFKERLSVKQWIGVCIGIVSVLFICNPLL